MPKRNFPKTKALFRRVFRRPAIYLQLKKKSSVENLILKKGGKPESFEVKGKAGLEHPMDFFGSHGIHGYSCVLNDRKYLFLVDRLSNKILSETICIEQEGKVRRREYFKLITQGNVSHILYTTSPRISPSEANRVLKHFMVE